MSFFAELKRRNVFKIALAYAVVAWLLVQVIVSIETPLNLPDWVDTFVIILLCIGFPITLIITWAFELSPEGIRKSGENITSNLHDRDAEITTSYIKNTKFCKTPDGVSLAYTTAGNGPSIVKTSHWLSHLELNWKSPVDGHLLRDLTDDFQITTYDIRGNGLSDWKVEDFSLKAFVSDLETVVDAVGLDKFTLLGFSMGCCISIAYAAMHPERLTHLILFGGFVRDFRNREQVEAIATLIEQGWGQKNPAFRQIFTSSLIPDATKEELNELNELQRLSTSPENAARIFRSIHNVDITALASKVTVPTLVLHSLNEQAIPLEYGREMASLIPGARFIGLQSENHILFKRDPAYSQFITEVNRFINEPSG